MANIPKSLKEKLKEYPITVLEELDVQTSKVDGTRKYLFRLSDGNMIESVLMRYKYGNSVCISSQAGCRMGCRFCASTIGGLTRNLLPSEMLDRSGTGTDACGNAGSDLPDTDFYRRAYLQCGGDGNR